jgi:hypothetical protein
VPAVARRIFLPDAPGGNVGQIMTIQADGMVTWADPPGGSGAPAAFTLVDSLSATPRLVTDWGPILNTAIGAGSRHFVFGSFDYPFTTQISFGAVFGVCFEGSASGGYAAGQAAQTRLIWGGGGSGVALDTYGSTFPVFRDMIIKYSSASFTGSLMSGGTFGHVIERCVLGDATNGPHTADCLLNLTNTNTFICRDTDILNDYTHTAVRGSSNPSGGNFSNVVKFEDCTFHRVAIIDPSNDWVLNQCVFELTQMAANESCITNSGPIIQWPQLTLRDCAYWDQGANAATNRIVKFTNAIPCVFSVYSCNDHTTGLAKLYDLQCGNQFSTVTIIGGNANSSINLGDGTTLAQRKDAIVVHGVYLANAAQLDNSLTGHGNVSIQGNVQGDNIYPRDGFQSIKTEIINANAFPTVAIHAGATNVTVEGSEGCDAMGNVGLLNVSGAGVVPAGLLADVTFRDPVTFPGRSVAASATVVVSPNDAVAAAAQPYAVVAANLSGFTIGVVNSFGGIPGNNTRAHFSWRAALQNTR